MQQNPDTKDGGHSRDIEKPQDEAIHMERLASHTTTNDLEKRQIVTSDAAVAHGPVLHEKVRARISHPFTDSDADVRPVQWKTLHDLDVHVVPLDRLPDPALPLRLSAAAHLPRHRRGRPLGVVYHWLPHSKCGSLPLRGRAFRSLWAAEGRYCWTGVFDLGTYHHCYRGHDEHCDWCECLAWEVSFANEYLAGSMFSGIGAGLNELIALAGERLAQCFFISIRSNEERVFTVSAPRVATLQKSLFPDSESGSILILHCRNGRSRTRQEPGQIRWPGRTHHPTLLSIGSLRSAHCEIEQLAVQWHFRWRVVRSHTVLLLGILLMPGA